MSAPEDPSNAAAERLSSFQGVPMGATATAPGKAEPPVWLGHRRCQKPGCITLLNRFNPGPYCLCHTREVREPQTTDEIMRAAA
jgi:hypothetical protein